MRHTKGHKGNRRSHHSLKEARVSKDKETGGTHMRHRASLATGMYRGKKVLNIEDTAGTQSSHAESEQNESGDSETDNN